VDAVVWTDRQASWLNWACIALALLGWLVQFLLDRRQVQRAEARRAEEKQIIAKAKEKEREAKAKDKSKDQPKPTPWWGWEVLTAMRKAG
jgi:hypothetical protein